MNPSTLITSKIVKYCEPLPLIFVMGYTKTGKVTIARKLAEQLNRTLYIADEFIEKHGYDHALDEFEMELERCYYSGEKVIFEGILCFRLLRILAKKGYIIPDMIIKTDCNIETITHFYDIEGEEKKNYKSFRFQSRFGKNI